MALDWTYWIDKNVYIITRKNRIYTGIIQDVDLDTSPIIWITIIDKYNQIVQLTTDEIVEIKEERHQQGDYKEELEKE